LPSGHFWLPGPRDEAGLPGSMAILALCVLVFALLAYEGWHILTYLKPPWEWTPCRGPLARPPAQRAAWRRLITSGDVAALRRSRLPAETRNDPGPAR
jgi:hypothetical protein